MRPTINAAWKTIINDVVNVVVQGEGAPTPFNYFENTSLSKEELSRYTFLFYWLLLALWP